MDLQVVCTFNANHPPCTDSHGRRTRSADAVAAHYALASGALAGNLVAEAGPTVAIGGEVIFTQPCQFSIKHHYM